eukprot:m.172564 g.172564  ORF g.172564 m.172564 type:complete len:132 (+) comp53268_c0_seq40:895-1290(+)
MLPLYALSRESPNTLMQSARRWSNGLPCLAGSRPHMTAEFSLEDPGANYLWRGVRLPFFDQSVCVSVRRSISLPFFFLIAFRGGIRPDFVCAFFFFGMSSTVDSVRLSFLFQPLREPLLPMFPCDTPLSQE